MEDWDIVDNKLVRVFEFDNFVHAVLFVNKIVPLAEEAEHHPDICVFDYKKVKISLCTHSAGNKITEKDLKLAKKISEL